MKFRITATSCWGNIGEMTACYPVLKDRVKMEQETITVNTLNGCSFTNTREECFIEISTLEELIELVKMCGKEIIILTDDDELTIEIYDDYRE